MKSKILPMQYPAIATWTWQAGIFSILQANCNNVDWIYSNYIQLVANSFSNTCNLDFIPRGDDSFFTCPLLYTQLIKRKLIKSFCNDYLEFIKKCIDQDNYIYMVVEQGCFLDYDSLPHDILIFGYDDSEEVVHVADFTFKNKYSLEKVPYESLIKSIDMISEKKDFVFDFKGGVLLLSYDKSSEYTFDTKLVRDSFIEYLECVETTDRFRSYRMPWRGETYGLEVYDTVIDFLRDIHRHKKEFDYRSLHNIYSHKVLMVKRLKYMQENSYIREAENIIVEYTNLKEQMLVLVNKFLRCMVRNNANTLPEIIDSLLKIKNHEKELITAIIPKLVVKQSDRIFIDKRVQLR